MAGLFSVLDLIEEEPSRKKKEEILQSHRSSKLLQKVLVYAMNPYVTYGVADISTICLPVKGDDMTLALEAFFDILDRLARRELVGNSAKYRLESFISNVGSPRAAKWMTRILLKNLRMGATAATVNKVWPGLIPNFAVQLANVMKGDIAKYPVIVDAKFDGLRLVAIKHSGEVKLYTRKGHEITTLPNIAEALKNGEYDDVVLDGEIMGADWNESQSVVASRVNTVDPSNMVYNVFDAVKYSDWTTQGETVELWKRKIWLEKLVKAIRSENVKDVPYGLAEDKASIIDRYNEHLKQGFEGSMVKDPDRSYEFKRSDAILKVKPTVTETGTVVGYERGTGKYEGMCGALSVSIKGVVTSVGTGLTDAMRAQIAEEPSAFIGRMVEVEGQEATKDGKIRFPRFKGFRSEEDT
jgi:DNA ligase-1